MGIDIRSPLRVALLNRTVVANTEFIVAEDIIKNNEDYESKNLIRPNQTGVAFYTVEFSPSVDGELSVTVLDDTVVPNVAKESIVYTGTAGMMGMFTLFFSVEWKVNFKYSENGKMDIFVLTEHGGVY